MRCVTLINLYVSLLFLLAIAFPSLSFAEFPTVFNNISAVGFRSESVSSLDSHSQTVPLDPLPPESLSYEARAFAEFNTLFYEIFVSNGSSGILEFVDYLSQKSTSKTFYRRTNDSYYLRKLPYQPFYWELKHYPSNTETVSAPTIIPFDGLYHLSQGEYNIPNSYSTTVPNCVLIDPIYYDQACYENVKSTNHIYTSFLDIRPLSLDSKRITLKSVFHVKINMLTTSTLDFDPSALQLQYIYKTIDGPKTVRFAPSKANVALYTKNPESAYWEGDLHYRTIIDYIDEPVRISFYFDKPLLATLSVSPRQIYVTSDLISVTALEKPPFIMNYAPYSPSLASLDYVKNIFKERFSTVSLTSVFAPLFTPSIPMGDSIFIYTAYGKEYELDLSAWSFVWMVLTTVFLFISSVAGYRIISGVRQSGG